MFTGRNRKARGGITKRGLHYVEPSEADDDLTREVIGAAMEVHTAFGPGFLESAYEQALCIELSLRGICFERQKRLVLDYKGNKIDAGRVDIIVEGKLVLELKTVDEFAPVHLAQLLSYLKATDCNLGLLLNFKVASVKDGIRRVVRS